MDLKYKLLPVVGLALFHFSGCGGYGGAKYYKSGSGQTWTVPGDNTTIPSSSGSSDNGTSFTSSSSGTTTTASAQASTGVPPITRTIHGIGYGSSYMDVQAHSVVKVRFTPGPPDTVVPGTGYMANYSKMWVYIQVGSTSQPTPILSNGLGTGAATSSPIMDFSSAFASTCTTTSCRQTVRIYIQQPNNDYYCLNFGAYCPGTHVRDGQPWNGTVEVQTDDTDPLE